MKPVDTDIKRYTHVYTDDNGKIAYDYYDSASEYNKAFHARIRRNGMTIEQRNNADEFVIPEDTKFVLLEKARNEVEKFLMLDNARKPVDFDASIDCIDGNSWLESGLKKFKEIKGNLEKDAGYYKGKQITAEIVPMTREEFKKKWPSLDATVTVIRKGTK